MLESTDTFQHVVSFFIYICPRPQASYLDFDWPAEVSHINVECDIVVKSEVELLAREAVTVLLNVGPGYDWHLFARDRPGWSQYGRRTNIRT